MTGENQAQWVARLSRAPAVPSFPPLVLLVLLLVCCVRRPPHRPLCRPSGTSTCAPRAPKDPFGSTKESINEIKPMFLHGRLFAKVNLRGPRTAFSRIPKDPHPPPWATCEEPQKSNSRTSRTPKEPQGPPGPPSLLKSPQGPQITKSH